MYHSPVILKMFSKASNVMYRQIRSPVKCLLTNNTLPMQHFIFCLEGQFESILEESLLYSIDIYGSISPQIIAQIYGIGNCAEREVLCSTTYLPSSVVKSNMPVN